MTMTPQAERFTRVRTQISDSAVRHNRRADSIRLLAVSKSQPASALRDLYALGQRHFGENYAQEMLAKSQDLRDLKDLEFVFIGTLQSNKIALIVQVARAIQSVGSERHARLVAKAVIAAGKSRYPVHLIVNAGNEDTKHGLPLAEVAPLAQKIEAEMPELELQGIMAIPPIGAAQDLYLQLARLAQQVGKGDLSLGMSADLEVAIAAGSTCVRVGTALFGPRPAR